MSEKVLFVCSKGFPEGAYIPQHEPVISAFDHGFLYGDGVFEGIRIYDGAIFRLDKHLDRLYRSLEYLGMEVPFDREFITDHMIEVARRNRIVNGYIRPVISRGDGDLGLNPEKCKHPTLVLIADTIILYPKEYYEEGLRLILSSIPKNSKKALNPNAKLTQYINNIRAVREANLRVAQEAMMLDSAGYVAECTGDNIFMINKKGLCTPTTENALPGITRETIVDIARNIGITVHEQRLKPHHFYKADEVFVTGTAAEVCPVREIESNIIGDGNPGPVTRQFMEEFRKATKDPKYLTHIHQYSGRS